MEIGLPFLRRPGLIILTACILFIGTGVIVWRIKIINANEAPTVEKPLQPLLAINAFPTSPPVGRPMLPVIEIRFRDESTSWDWQ